MNATSPYLNAPKRSEAEAMFDVRDRRNRLVLRDVLDFLVEHGAEQTLAEAVDYAIDQLDKHAAARILERNKNGT